MLLIGMFDSPYVRRVAISMRTLGIAFEHASWSVGKDLARIVQYNPLGQVPALVLDDGEVLIESAAILDYLDQRVGPERAVVPPSGHARRRVLQLVALGTGVADKARMVNGERLFRPADKRHEPYAQRVREQMVAAAAALDRACAARGEAPWLVGEALTQADITLAAAITYALDSAKMPEVAAAMPALHQRVARLNQLPVFREIYLAFDAPVV